MRVPKPRTSLRGEVHAPRYFPDKGTGRSYAQNMDMVQDLSGVTLTIIQCPATTVIKTLWWCQHATNYWMLKSTGPGATHP